MNSWYHKFVAMAQPVEPSCTWREKKNDSTNMFSEGWFMVFLLHNPYPMPISWESLSVGGVIGW